MMPEKHVARERRGGQLPIFGFEATIRVQLKQRELHAHISANEVLASQSPACIGALFQ
jgi:hypothetical protein